MKYVALAALLAVVAAPAMAEDLVFKVQNNSKATVTELYVSPTQKDEWGPNIIEGQVAPPGSEITVTITGGKEVCNFDMRFVGQGGEELEESGDFCGLETYTLTD